MKRIILCALMALPVASHAEPGQDSWGDHNVSLHFAGEAALGSIAGAVIEDKRIAFAAAFAVGLAREQWKREHGYSNYTPNRLIADGVGAALGVYVGSCVLTGRAITCHMQF
jgi:hypothetical protein